MIDYVSTNDKPQGRGPGKTDIPQSVHYEFSRLNHCIWTTSLSYGKNQILNQIANALFRDHK